MRGRVHHASMRRAFLLAPLTVAGSVWPAMGAGSVPTHPVPVVIDDTACDPSALEVGETTIRSRAVRTRRRSRARWSAGAPSTGA